MGWNSILLDSTYRKLLGATKLGLTKEVLC